MAERLASVSEDELCEKCLIKQLLNSLFAWYNELSKPCVCVICLSLRLRQITQTSVLIIHDIMLNLIQNCLIYNSLTAIVHLLLSLIWPSKRSSWTVSPWSSLRILLFSWIPCCIFIPKCTQMSDQMLGTSLPRFVFDKNWVKEPLRESAAANLLSVRVESKHFVVWNRKFVHPR